MTGDGDDVKIFMGESFIQCSEEYATEYCEKEQEKLQGMLDTFKEEETAILERQKELKVVLYGRFGDAINLEA
ncbi:unnamed protein product [Heterosigma akashiwo]